MSLIQFQFQMNYGPISNLKLTNGLIPKTFQASKSLTIVRLTAYVVISTDFLHRWKNLIYYLPLYRLYIG